MKTALITGAAASSPPTWQKSLPSKATAGRSDWTLPPCMPLGGPLDDYVAADLTSSIQTEQAIRQIRPDLVFHLAGRIQGMQATCTVPISWRGVCLLEVLRLHRPDARVIVTGSAAEYGPVAADLPVSEEHPCNPERALPFSKYALTLAALDAARRHGMKVAVARPFNLVGPGVPRSVVVGAVLGRLTAALASPGEAVVAVGNLDTQRDFIAVQDAARAYVVLIQREHWGEIFNICSGVPTPIRAVVETLLSFAPRQVRLLHDPALARPFRRGSHLWELGEGEPRFRLSSRHAARRGALFRLEIRDRLERTMQ